jgi:PIN domain nuclease of toxin-antitoxin system
MKLLIDSHIFLWWANEPERLPSHVRAVLAARGVTLLLSLASIWEMQIKIQLGKLVARPSLQAVIADQQRENELVLLPITLQHILALGSLPPHHRDPFDRLIIAQAVQENATLVSVDPIFSQYRVSLLA